ncbi:Ankyrin repeat-containing domain protein [Elaphomyces granulatus]
MCGPTEIDGYAFSLGLGFYKDVVPPVISLIRGAIFRPDYSMGRSGRFSLDICPLGELIDMYHAHEAARRHDKVYALLGMSSDDLSKVNLSPDYNVRWEELLQRLVKYLLCEEIFVETWADREIAIIKSKGCILGKVVRSNDIRWGDDGVTVDIIFKNTPGQPGMGYMEKRAHWTVPASEKSIQDGDIICLLQGASRPSVIRLCKDHFTIIMIAADLENVYTEWPKLFQSETVFTRDFILVWDWESSLENEALIQTNIWESERSKTKFHLEKATRTWNVSLILGDLEEYQEAEEGLREAIEGYKIAFGEERPHTLQSQCGLTPLLWASGNGYDTVVKLLLGEDGVDPDLNDSQYGRTPLSWAAECGHEAVVKLLLETGRIEVNSKDVDGRTPLSWAAGNGYDIVVNLLLGKDVVDPDLKDNAGRTPLSWAAENGHEAVVKLLLETGRVEVDSKDDFGRTPLLRAASKGHEAAVKLLFETGRVEIDIKDNYEKDTQGRTPLLLAAENGHEAMVRLLLETGKVEVDSKDNRGRTPLSLAAANGHEAVVKLLLETGKVELNSQDKYGGRTPLLWAAINGHVAVVKLLFETGKAEVDLKDNEGRTPLSLTASSGHEAVVKLLLETGKVEVDLKDRRGRTPLLLAASNGHEAVVKLLLETGKVEVNSEDNAGRTPLSMACEHGHEAVVKLLQSFRSS